MFILPLSKPHLQQRTVCNDELECYQCESNLDEDGEQYVKENLYENEKISKQIVVLVACRNFGVFLVGLRELFGRAL